MTLRNLMIAFALLVVAGCGCNDDSTPPGGGVNPVGQAVMVLGTRLAPIPVPPPTQTAPFKIDVTFVLDDGDHMIDRVIGLLPSVPGDPRTRMEAAQEIFRKMQADLLTRFDAEWQAQNPGTTTPTLDLAFAVTRYEDFGGSFTDTNLRNRAQGDVDDPTNKNNDQDARPFILNMPILRTAHPAFTDLFATALVREAPGDGAPIFGGVRAVDAQSGIEALWQIAAPTDPQTGDIGGFDGDGNGNTLGSGQPTSLTEAGRDATMTIGSVAGGPFQIGEVLNFAPSGAIAIATAATADGDADIAYFLTSGSPQPADVITGASSGASTTALGAAVISPASNNPQTYPGASGDVPAVRFTPYPAGTVTPMNSNLVGEDDDGEPLFQVTDETGAAVTISNPAGGTMPSPASGNLGQVGWRPDAARFVILSSSVATVAPTETQPQGTPEALNPAPVPPPAVGEQVSSTTYSGGAGIGLREARTVELLAFDGGPVASGVIRFADRRTGLRDGVSVAPTNARTVNETIARLNALDIEVLLLGTPIAGGLDTKPGTSGVNGDEYSNAVGGINGDLFDPTDPAIVAPERAPWFWFNAVSTLTTPPITSIAPLNRATPSIFPSDDLFWGVYNMGTVWPIDNTLVPNTAQIRPVMTDDLAERIVAWIDSGELPGGTSAAPRPTLPTVQFELTLEMLAGSNVDVIQTNPAPGGVPTTTFTVTVEVPAYYDDTAAPADVEVLFPAGTTLTYQTVSDQIPLPATTTIPFTMMSMYTTQIGADATNLVQQALIEDLIKARGDGFTVDGMGNIVPLANATDPIIQAQGSTNLLLANPLIAPSEANLAGVIRGGFFVRDLNPGSGGAGVDQVGGTLPFAPNP